MQQPGFADGEMVQFLIPYPSYPLTTDLQTITTDLAAWANPSPSHIIVVDAQQRPVGAVGVGRLWQLSRPKTSLYQALANTTLAPEDSPATHPQRLDGQPWLEPILAIPVQTPLAQLGSLLPKTAPPCWVAVNGQGQYQGVLDSTALLRWCLAPPPPLRAPISLAPSWATAPITVEPGRERQWVMAISHALKTPLTSLLGLSTLLLDHRVGSLTERQMRYAILMRRAIRKLIRLINQLVDWMRLESDQLILDQAPLDLDALADTLIPSFLSSCLPDATTPPGWVDTFSLELPSKLPTVVADRLRVQQSLHGVLDYLIQREANPQGLILEPWGHWLGLELWATPAAPSGQAELTSLQPWAGGIGQRPENDGLDHLGLALAQRLCQLQGGELTGFYLERYGYRLTLLLPLDPDLTLAPNSPSLVLLVSPQVSLVEQVYTLLQASDYRLVIALHWDAARSLIQRLTPMAVLLDGDALDRAPALAIREMQTLPRPPSLRVILGQIPDLTGETDAIILPTPTLADRLLPTLSQAMPSPPLEYPHPPSTPPPFSSGPGGVLTLLMVHPPPWGSSPDDEMRLPQPWRMALQAHHCRLLQAADLAQARLLCRVWQPQAIVLDCLQSPTPEDWQQIAQIEDLVRLPWISLIPLGPLPHPRLRLVDGSSAFSQPIEQGVTMLIQMIQDTSAMKE